MKIHPALKVKSKVLIVVVILIGAWIIYSLGFNGPIADFAFVDYPSKVTEIKVNAIDWNNEANKEYFTYQSTLNEAIKSENIDFAGKYTVAIIGCGTACSHAYLINRETGLIIDTKITAENGFEYRKDSNLFVVNGVEALHKVYGKEIPANIITKYYVLENDVLKLLEKKQ